MSVLFRIEGSCGHGSTTAAVVLVLVLLLGRSDAASSSSEIASLFRKDVSDPPFNYELEKAVEAPISANGTIVAPHYKSNLELEAALQNFTQRCSHISRLYSIGNSTLGVPLWALEISDKPAVSEPEPAFKYVGNMHGDEPLGRELVLLLADWLCDNYLEDPLATLIVDKLHLHLLPSMNPDGFAALPKPTRNNAHNIDLNRDFPDQFFSGNNIEEKRQAETRAVMGWIRSTRFTASASFHEGALVANYPYDGNPDISQTYSSSPDDSTFKYLAGIYAENHPLMLKSKEFAGGVTNGAAWYPLYGGMQDWNYLHGNCLELTLEMNDNKWPPFIELPQIWSEHRKSMLELVAATVTSGVHGRVVSSRGAKPLAATINVSGISLSMNASAGFGDYHRLLAPGQVYEVTASMAGYSSRSTSIFLPNDTALTLDFILDPLPTGAGGARLRGQGLFDEENFRFVIPPDETAATKAAVEEQGLKTSSAAAQKPPVEMVTWKPARRHRKDVHLDDGSPFPFSTQYHPMYLLPLVSVLAILVCLFLASRGGNIRYQRLKTPKP